LIRIRLRRGNGLEPRTHQERETVSAHPGFLKCINSLRLPGRKEPPQTISPACAKPPVFFHNDFSTTNIFSKKFPNPSKPASRHTVMTNLPLRKNKSFQFPHVSKADLPHNPPQNFISRPTTSDLGDVRIPTAWAAPLIPQQPNFACLPLYVKRPSLSTVFSLNLLGVDPQGY